DVPQWEVFFKR
nr:Chain B, Artemis-derived peptide [Homo sapiens]3W1G_B Chain B, Artemis-derived peptide [Homo sapiens]4HTP_C Chain C, Protein artemis [Homo sapiens]4HTP_E Chain E, Protein artemis [Homo sapiens]